MFNKIFTSLYFLKIKFSEDIRGAAALEYVFIVAAIAIVIFPLLSQDGTFMKALNTAFSDMTTAFTEATKKKG